MSDKEQIKEMSYNLNLVMDYDSYIYSEDCGYGEESYADIEVHYDKMAKELIDKGWTKQVWHKVADEGFPVNNGWYICALTDDTIIWTRPMKFRQSMFVVPEDPRIFDGIAHKQVIAWTELPKYKKQ